MITETLEKAGIPGKFHLLANACHVALGEAVSGAADRTRPLIPESVKRGEAK